MKKRLLVGSGTVLVLANLVLGIRLYTATAAAPADENGYADLAVFARALEMIRQDYVDEEKINYHDLTYAALRGMLNGLDPHSQFMAPEDFKGMQDDTKSEFGGLGVIVASKDGKLVVVAPMDDSPGARAGIEANDQILRINGKSTDDLDVTGAVQLLRGPVGEKVTLTILRAADHEVKEVELTREVIKVASVKDGRLLDPRIAGNLKIGYVRITQFNEPTAEELAKQLNRLETEGMQALVLDLRYNPGGLLSSAVEVCGEFLPPKTKVVYTDGRSASQRREFATSANARNRRMPMAVLINSGSASGAEIVAGALKDLNRAVLVGETTFGKGSVQSVMPLQDGSALRITTAKYYTPSRQVIHEKGVAPNITVTLTEEQEKQLLVQRREELSVDVAPARPAHEFRDTQLERATDALKGLMIYVERTEQSRDKKSAGQ
jgi:carboxyl-terminal processing protease